MVSPRLSPAFADVRPPRVTVRDRQLRFSDMADADQILHRLASPHDVRGRLAVLEELVEWWHGPIPASAEQPSLTGRIDASLPLPLRWLYGRFGTRSEFFSHQNYLLPPERLEVVAGGRVRFYAENQGVYVWATASSGDDPPVWGRFNQEDLPWDEEAVSLSEFLIQVALFEATMGAPFGASAAWLPASKLRRVCEVLAPVPLGPWRWPSDPTRFYASGGALMFAAPNGEQDGRLGFSVWVGAKTRDPLSFLTDIVDDAWEYVSF
jgi:hypothetical protein